MALCLFVHISYPDCGVDCQQDGGPYSPWLLLRGRRRKCMACKDLRGRGGPPNPNPYTVMTYDNLILCHKFLFFRY